MFNKSKFKIYFIVTFLVISGSAVIFGQHRSLQTNFSNINEGKDYHYDDIGSSSNLSLIGRWPYGPCDAVCVKDDYAYIGNGSVMTILDISDPILPKKVGEIETPGIVKDIYVHNNYAYIANWREGIRVIDVSDPSEPVEVGYENCYCAMRLTGLRDILFASTTRSTAIFNIGAPAGPEKENSIGAGNTVWDIAVLKTSKDYLCVAGSLEGLRIYDVTNIYDIFEVGYLDSIGSVRDVFVENNLAYLVNYDYLIIIDLSDPSEPAIVGVYGSNKKYQFCNIFVSNGHAYITDELYGGLWIFDVSNPTHPVEKGYYHSGSGDSEGITVVGQHAYVAHGSSGLQIVDVSDADNPIGISSYETVGALDNSIIVQNDIVYTMVGLKLGLFDISDKENPKLINSIQANCGLIREIHICNGFAYLAGEVGIVIINIEDKDNLMITGTYLNLIGKTSSVDVKGSFAYVACRDGFRVLDVSDKAAPREVWFQETPVRASKVILHQNYAYLAVTSLGLQVFDISKPDEPVLIAQENCKDGSFMLDMHFSEPYLYVAASAGGVQILDVSKPAHPTWIASYKGGFSRARKVHFSDNYIYITNGINGLWVIDATLPEQMKEIAHFDVGDYAENVYVSGNMVFLISYGSGLYILKNELAGQTVSVPSRISLKQNHPNPFNTSTTIRFELSKPSRIKIKIFDINGRELDTLIHNVLYNTGTYEIIWNPGSISSGIYIYQLITEGYVEVRKMICIR